jgi:hypothetical protein
MEDMNQYYGFILYKNTLSTLGSQPMNVTLDFPQMHDRAQIFLDGTFQGAVWRGDSKTNNVPIEIKKLVRPFISLYSFKFINIYTCHLPGLRNRHFG